MGKVLYVHKTPDNIIFYIGIGTNKDLVKKQDEVFFGIELLKNMVIM